MTTNTESNGKSKIIQSITYQLFIQKYTPINDNFSSFTYETNKTTDII